MRLFESFALGLVTWGAIFGCGESSEARESACDSCSASSGASGSAGAPAVSNGGSSGHAGRTGVVSVAGESSAGTGGTFASAGNAGSQSSSGSGGTRSETGGASEAGRAGGAGGSVEFGAPVRLANPALVSDIAVQDGYVYYSDFDTDSSGDTDGHVSRVAVSGGPPTVLAHAPTTSETLYAESIIVHGQYIYWTESRLLSGGPRIAKVPIEGGEVVDVWTDSRCSEIPSAMALDGDDLYWFAACQDLGSALWTISTKGGEPRVVASGIGVDWPKADGTRNNRCFTVGNGQAFWTKLTGPVLSLPLSGGAQPTRLMNGGSDGPSAILYSRDRLFFLSILYVGQGMVRSLVPGQGVVSLAEKQTFQKYNALALDDASVYWGVIDSIRSVPRDGGVPVTVVSSANNPRSFALDDDALYWTNDGSGVWRAPKRAP
jgi:hypothetical protein